MNGIRLEYEDVVDLTGDDNEGDNIVKAYCEDLIEYDNAVDLLIEVAGIDGEDAESWLDTAKYDQKVEDFDNEYLKEAMVPGMFDINYVNKAITNLKKAQENWKPSPKGVHLYKRIDTAIEELTEVLNEMCKLRREYY